MLRWKAENQKQRNELEGLAFHIASMERTRMDMEQEVVFAFDTTQAKEFSSFRTWLKSQKATKDCGTYGEALKVILGIITYIPNKYREFD